MNKKFSVKLFSSLTMFLTAAAIVVSVTAAPFVLPSDETETVTSVMSGEEDKEHRPQCDDDPVFGHIEDY